MIVDTAGGTFTMFVFTFLDIYVGGTDAVYDSSNGDDARSGGRDLDVY
jgi:hypothetical protein